MKVQGLGELMRKLEQVKGEARGTMKIEVRKALMDIEDGAKDEVPYLTGALHDSISYALEGEGLNGRVFSDSDYANAIEFGTRRSVARPFMWPAFRKVRRRFRSRLKREMDKALKRAAGSV